MLRQSFQPKNMGRTWRLERLVGQVSLAFRVHDTVEKPRRSDCDSIGYGLTEIILRDHTFVISVQLDTHDLVTGNGYTFDILVDAGASRSVCVLQHFQDFPLESRGSKLRHHGDKHVRLKVGDGDMHNRIGCATDVTQPILSVNEAQLARRIQTRKCTMS